MLELGGADYFIVLADADLEEAARSASARASQNTGQSCIAAKRFIVEDAVYDRYAELFVRASAQAAARRPGAARHAAWGRWRAPTCATSWPKQVDDTLRAGAKLLLGGKQPDRAGAFYEPTVVGDVTPGMRMADEETFGPAAALMRARDAEHALEFANDCRYGLGGNLWTRDIARAEAARGAAGVGQRLHQRHDRRPTRACRSAG